MFKKKNVLRNYFIGYTALFIICLFLPSNEGVRNFGIIISIAVMGITGMWLLFLRARKKGGGWEQQRLIMNSPAKSKKRTR